MSSNYNESKKKYVAFTTLGCKVNQYETENIKNYFLESGYEIKEFDDYADIYVVNSCTVTSIADRKTRNMLRRAKKINTDAIIVATGCYVQTNPDDVLKIQEVDILIGNSEKNNIVKIIEAKAEEVKTERKQWVEVSNIFENPIYQEHEFGTFREMTRAYVKIQDGCNSFCSYCKIPFARGKSRSREIENIKKEVTLLAQEGYKEIILIGINIGEYGLDLEAKSTLENVIDMASEINGIERIRLGSIYPDRINEKFIKTVKENKKLMPHFHISMQSGDDEILKLMKRKYTVKEAENNLEKLREIREDISFTADIIVGFPGETEELFENTLRFAKRSLFTDIHVFQYSDRENTAAAKFKGKVSAEDKKRRASILEEQKDLLNYDFIKAYIGRKMKILIEETDQKSKMSYGYSENYLRASVLLIEDKTNNFVDVLVKDIREGLLICDKI